jgi:ankyrin repeat protein
MVSLLLDRGARVNAKSPEGVTPLALAIERGHALVADLLRRSGAVE